jgi:hypothetical protein
VTMREFSMCLIAAAAACSTADARVMVVAGVLVLIAAAGCVLGRRGES